MNNIYTTQFGEANFPHLNKPDTQFNSQGIYQVKLLVKAVDAEGDINIINQIIDNEVSIQQNKQLDKKDSLLRAPLPFKSIEDGRIQFQFKSKFKPKLFDHNLDILDDNKFIWGGSIIRVNYKPASYYVPKTGVGCTLRLVSVQVKQLIEGNSALQGFEPIENNNF